MKKGIFLIAALVFMTVLSFPNLSQAFYKWVDEKGHLHITDYPPPQRLQAEEIEKAEPIGRSEESQPMSNEQEMKALSVAPSAKQPEPLPMQPARPLQPAPGDNQVKKPPEPVQQPMQPAGKQAAAAPVVPGNAVQGIPISPAPRVPGLPQPGMPPLVAKDLSPEMISAILAGFTTIFLVVGIGIYVFSALCMFLIAKKLDVPAAWTAWVPILQVWAFFRSAGKSLWWILLFFIPLVNAVVGVYLWMCVAENLGRNKWLGLLMLVPIVSFVFMGVLAFTKKEGMNSPRLATA